MAALSDWTPNLIITPAADLGGTKITSEHWRSLWLVNQVQGDDTASTLKQLIDELLLSIWHPTNGADYVSAPVRYVGDLYDTVGGQIRDSFTAIQDTSDYMYDTLEPKVDALIAGTTPAGDATLLDGQLPAYYATEADLTALEDAVALIAAGEISAFNHNDIGTRDAIDAHPIASITDLATTLAGLATAIDDLTAADILYATGTTVAAKITAMDQLIALLSGGISSMNHVDLLARDATNAHPQSAITDLVSALAGKQATITGGATTIAGSNLTASRALVSDSNGKVAVATTTAAELNYVNGVTSAIQTQINAKQKQITASTSAPTGGSDGDVWVVYS